MLRRPLLCAFLGLLALALPGCLPESESATATPTFEVLGTAVDGRADVARNQPIEVLFSEDIDPLTVDDLSIQLLPGPDFQDAIPLDFDVSGPAATIYQQHPTGLRPNTDYRVHVTGYPRFHSVRPLRDERVVPNGPYVRSFRTTSDYVPDLTPPTIRGGAPIRAIGSIGEITVSFSEAIDPRTDAGPPFEVVDPTGHLVPGRFEFRSKRLDEIVFVPEYETLLTGIYTLRASHEITDLAGNALAGSRDVAYELRSELPGDRLVFDLTSHAGDVYRAPGVRLNAAGAAVRAETTTLPPVPSSVESATWPEGVSRRIQMLFRPEQIGDAGEVHRLYFELEGSPENDVVLSQLEIRLWHTDREELDDVFAVNRPGRQVHTEAYPFVLVPAASANDFFPVSLKRPFSYDGERNLIVEILHFGASDPLDAAGIEGDGRVVRVSGPASESFGRGESVVDDVRFGIVTGDRFIEWNRFVDLGGARVRGSLVHASLPHAEDFVLIEYEGTDHATVDGRELGATTGLQRRLSQIDGQRHVRFRMHILRDADSDLPLELESLELSVE